MRKITNEACIAFDRCVDYKKANTEVRVSSYGGLVEMYLHGNLIASKLGGELMITNASWATTTTKERLNGLTGVSIVQRKGVWFLNGKEWSGEWVNPFAFNECKGSVTNANRELICTC